MGVVKNFGVFHTAAWETAIFNIIFSYSKIQICEIALTRSKILFNKKLNI